MKYDDSFYFISGIQWNSNTFFPNRKLFCNVPMWIGWQKNRFAKLLTAIFSLLVMSLHRCSWLESHISNYSNSLSLYLCLSTAQSIITNVHGGWFGEQIFEFSYPKKKHKSVLSSICAQMKNNEKFDAIFFHIYWFWNLMKSLNSIICHYELVFS